MVAGCGPSSTTAEAAPETAARGGAGDRCAGRESARSARLKPALEISGTLTPRSARGGEAEAAGHARTGPGGYRRPGHEGPDHCHDRSPRDRCAADASVAAVAVAKASLDNTEAGLANAVLDTIARRTCSRRARCPASASRPLTPRTGPPWRSAISPPPTWRRRTPRCGARAKCRSNVTVTSPVTGFVVERNYDAGAIPGDLPIVVVADLRQMKLAAGVDETRGGPAARRHEGGGAGAGQAGRNLRRPARRHRAGS